MDCNHVRILLKMLEVNGVNVQDPIFQSVFTIDERNNVSFKSELIKTILTELSGQLSSPPIYFTGVCLLTIGHQDDALKFHTQFTNFLCFFVDYLKISEQLATKKDS